jgi:toxin CcdB
MARFDVYPNPDPSERDRIPFLLDVQSDHVRGLQTRVVVPLWLSSVLQLKVDDINPEFDVAGLRVVMDAPALGALPSAVLRPSVANLAPQQLLIQNALDTLFGGY